MRGDRRCPVLVRREGSRRHRELRIHEVRSKSESEEEDQREGEIGGIRESRRIR